MNFPLYRPVAPVETRRWSLPVVTLAGVVLGAVLVASGVTAFPVLTRALLTQAGFLRAALVLAACGFLLAVGVGESRLWAALRRRRGAAAYLRDRAAFDADLRAALEHERVWLVRRARESGGLVLGAGAVDSGVRVAGEAGVRVQERVPLVVPPRGTIRVLGPPALAEAVAERLSSRADVGRAGLPGASRAWKITSDGGEMTDDWRADVWLGPDGSACARARGQADGAWVPIEPWLG